jgi:hypothetical protein
MVRQQRGCEVNTPRLWLRIGDQADYAPFDSVADACAALTEAGVEASDVNPEAMALYAPGFNGQNYVSIFWGDADAQPVRNLTKREARTILDTTNPVTDVCFRWCKDEGTGRLPGECVALFPGLCGTNDPATCSMFVHNGQHGSADPMLTVRTTRPATPDQYEPLQRELEGRGYRLRLVSRIGSHYYTQRRDALARLK